MLHITIDETLFDRIGEMMGATDREIDAARTSSLRKMRKRTETHIKRRAAKILGIPQKALAGRFFSNFIEPGGDALKVWIGAWNIEPNSIGTPKIYGTPGKSGGVRVGRRSYPGAFLAKIYTEEVKTWIRLRSSHFDQALYPTGLQHGSQASKGQGRFPVVRAAIPIGEVISTVLDQDGPLFEEDFEKVFINELNYQVNVKRS
jgi:hypothetical protein